MWGLSPVAASGGHSSSRCAGLSLSWPLLLQSTGSRRAGSVVVAHGPSCSAACGIFPDQGSNPCPLHWQADSQPLRHRESPISHLLQSQTLKAMAPFNLSFTIPHCCCTLPVLHFHLEFPHTLSQTYSHSKFKSFFSTTSLTIKNHLDNLESHWLRST